MSRLSSLGTAKALIRSNGLVWGLLAIGGFALTRLRSKLLGVALRAPGINVGPNCHISGIRCIRFGRDISARGNLWLEAVTRYQGSDFSPVIAIGDRVSFSDAVHITAIHRVSIGDDVLFGSNVFVSDHNHGAYRGDEQSAPGEPPARRALHSAGAVVIEANVWLGDNVNIVGPVTIGFGAIVGANSVVRADVPARSMVAGAPATLVKVFDERAGQWRKPGAP